LIICKLLRIIAEKEFVKLLKSDTMVIGLFKFMREQNVMLN